MLRREHARYFGKKLSKTAAKTRESVARLLAARHAMDTSVVLRALTIMRAEPSVSVHYPLASSSSSSGGDEDGTTQGHILVPHVAHERDEYSPAVHQLSDLADSVIARYTNGTLPSCAEVKARGFCARHDARYGCAATCSASSEAHETVTSLSVQQQGKTFGIPGIIEFDFSDGFGIKTMLGGMKISADGFRIDSPMGGVSINDQGFGVSTPMGGLQINGDGFNMYADMIVSKFEFGVSENGVTANVEMGLDTPLGGWGVSAGTSGVTARAEVNILGIIGAGVEVGCTVDRGCYVSHAHTACVHER